MRRPEWQEIRQSFARRLREEPSHDKRRAMIEVVQDDPGYQEARTESLQEQQRYYEMLAHLDTESNIDARGREAIIEGAADLAKLITSKFPQQNPDGSVHYYFVGSLSVMLLAQADKMTSVGNDGVAHEDRDIPESARLKLGQFTRPIGDIDFVRVGKFRGRDTDMGKGGGSIMVEDLTPSMRQAITLTGKEESLFADPVDASYTTPRAVRVTVGDADFYIADPRDMLVVKVEHIAQNFAIQVDKAEKFTKDFSILLAALTELGYSRDELVGQAREVLLTSMPKSPGSSSIPYHNALLGGELAEFFDDIIEGAEGIQYVRQIPWAKEKAIGILKILRRFGVAENKQKIIEYIDANREHIDKWNASTSSNTNNERLAKALYDNEELREDFARRSRVDTPSVDAFKKALETQAWAFREYAEKVPDNTLPDRIPARSDALQILVHVGPENLDEELKIISAISQKFGDKLFCLSLIFERNILCPKYGRSELPRFLANALEKINDPRSWEMFTFVLKKCLVDDVLSGEDPPNPDANQREELIRQACVEFGVDPL